MRYRRDDEPYNKAENMIIDRIRRYPSLYNSRMDVLKDLLLTYCGSGEYNNPWKDGELVEDVYPGIDPEPFVISQEYAERIFEYGHQSHVCILPVDWSDTAVIHQIPDDVKQEWLDLVEDFICYMVKFPEDDYKLHIESKLLTSYDRNMVGFTDWFPRYIKGYENAIVGLDEIAEKHGWTYWTRSVYHSDETKAERKKDMRELLDYVFKKADEE